MAWVRQVAVTNSGGCGRAGRLWGRQTILVWRRSGPDQGRRCIRQGGVMSTSASTSVGRSRPGRVRSDMSQKLCSMAAPHTLVRIQVGRTSTVRVYFQSQNADRDMRHLVFMYTKPCHLAVHALPGDHGIGPSEETLVYNWHCADAGSSQNQHICCPKDPSTYKIYITSLSVNCA